MALIRNGSHQLSGLSRHYSALGAGALRSALDSSGQARNFDSGQHAIANVTNRASIPQGMRGGGTWKMATKTGALVSSNDVTGTFTLTGTGNYGRNLDATINWDTIINQADLALIVGATATINFDTTITQADLGGTQNMDASFTGMTFTINSVISAESGLDATITFSATLNGSVATAFGDMEAVISGATEALTPASVAQEVWNSVALAFNTAGTMGNKMNSAASAGDPWTTNLPAAYAAGTAGQIIGTLQNDINLHTDSAIATLNLAELKFAIESLRPHHTGYGTAYFWNPTSGSDVADGLTPENACATFAHIHDNLVENYGHDIIYCLPESAGTGITSAEGIVISKNYLFVRGPGRDFEIDTSISGGAGVQITAKGVELHGVRVKTDPLSSADAIIISGDFAFIDDVWIDTCGGDAIAISGSRNSIINECSLTGFKGNGINIGNGVYSMWLNQVVLDGNGNGIDGVHIDGATSSDIRMTGRCEITGNTGYGVNLVSGGMRTMLSTDAHIENNTAGDLYDPNSYLRYDGRVYAENVTGAANIKQVNGYDVTGNGQLGTEWGPV